MNGKKSSFLIWDRYCNLPDETLSYEGKQLELRDGARVKTILISSGSLKLKGPVDIDQIVVTDPRLDDGSCAPGIWLDNVSGRIGSISTMMTQRAMGKIGENTHDLIIGWWLGRAIELEDRYRLGQPPQRGDAIQVTSCQNVTIGLIDIENQIPGSTNSGVQLNSEKDDPKIISNFIIGGGQIIFPNTAMYLNACTHCGARNTVFKAKFPFWISDKAVSVVDEDNVKITVTRTDIPPR